MTNEERAALVERLRVHHEYKIDGAIRRKTHEQACHERIVAADQIEADGKRIANLEQQSEIARERIAELEAALRWISKVCVEEYPLEYNDRMRKVFQRNIGDAARKAFYGETK